MGLDMYLQARRAFAPESDAAKNILATAGITLDTLKAKADADPMEEETSIYLSRWKFRGETDESRMADAVEEAAGLLVFAVDDSEGGHLAWVKDQEAVVVSITCMYWRKANAIHAWFVDNCQAGVDDCGEYLVHPEQMAQLRTHCLQELEAYKKGQAGQILTPRAGFFFGGTEVDEWYARELQETVDGLERVINLAIQIGGIDFYYHSSW
jgi:hypothetical protein